MNTQKLDFYQAAKLTLLNSAELREYYENEENISLKNFDSLSGAEQYDIAQAGVSIGFIKSIGKLINGEEAFAVATAEERAKVGPRHFVGDKKTYVINPPIENIILDAASVEGTPELESWEKV